MIDSIGGSGVSSSTSRAHTALEPSRLRSTEVLTAIQQTSQKASGAPAPMTVFAVPQADKSAGASASTARLPRGSLVDVLV